MKKRKVCVITGTRADYGQLFWLMKDILKEPLLDLQLIATGTHCSPEFGLTYRLIENDGFSIIKKIEILLSADTPTSISKATSLGLIGFADAYADLQPDIIIILGDRFELLSASIAALYARIPIGHIHGGEITSGAFDESIRHSITKMSWLHFVATAEYKKRVIQLGENPDRVYIVGGMGVDNIKKSKLLSKRELCDNIKFEFGPKNLSVTFHPVTLEKNSSKKHFQELLNALDTLKNTKIIFTAPNADTDGRIIKRMIDKFVENNNNAVCFTTMGDLNYLSMLQFVDGIVGNSSSGLSEAPTFKIGTVNIGDRQKGRLKAKSVIDCEPTAKSIMEAIETLYSQDFQNILPSINNPYDKGNATESIIEVLKNKKIPKEIKKEFFDL